MSPINNIENGQRRMERGGWREEETCPLALSLRPCLGVGQRESVYFSCLFPLGANRLAHKTLKVLLIITDHAAVQLGCVFLPFS